MKGISAILAILLIVMITISIAGLTWVFLFRITTTTTNIAETRVKNVSSSFLARMKIESMSTNNIYVRNMGQSDMSGITVMVNDVISNFNITPSVIKSGGTGVIRILDIIKEDDDIRVFNAQGASASIKAPDPCEKAALCLSFDEGSGTTVYDSSPNNNGGIFSGENINDGSLGDGTCNPGSGKCPSRVNGHFGNALNFDGNDDMVSIIDSGDLTIPEYLTISAWININGNNSDTGVSGASYRRQIVRKEPSYLLRVQNSSTVNNLLTGYINNTTAWKSCSSSTSLNYNTWYFVAMTYNNSDKVMKLYINGSLDKSCALTPALQISTNSNNVYIGFINSQYSFNGTIDEVRIWNKTLSLTEIQNEMRSSLSIIRPLASYRFEELGNFANDTHIWVQGVNGPALSFDGVNDYVLVQDSESLNVNAITIETLIKQNSFENNWARLVSRPRDGAWGSSETPWRIGIGTASNVYSSVKATGGTSISSYWGFFVPNNTWLHLALTYDSINGMKTWVNSIPKIQTGGGEIDNAITSDMFIGYMLNGTIDEVRIYNKAIY